MSRVIWPAGLLASRSLLVPRAQARTADDFTQGGVVSSPAAANQAAHCPAGPTTVTYTVGC